MKQLKKGPDIKKKQQGYCSSRASGHGKGPDPSLTSHVHSKQQCPQEAPKGKASFKSQKSRLLVWGGGGQQDLGARDVSTAHDKHGSNSKACSAAIDSRLLPLSLRDLVHLQGLPLVNYSCVKIPASPQHPLHSSDLTASQLLELLGSEALTPVFFHVIPVTFRRAGEETTLILITSYRE